MNTGITDEVKPMNMEEFFERVAEGEMKPSPCSGNRGDWLRFLVLCHPDFCVMQWCCGIADAYSVLDSILHPQCGHYVCRGQIRPH